ncbi:4-hydroxy-3-methylbut-2-enyl diphosphate reductase, partial [Prochlorococcus sp. AH-736-L15]|nr:4-hydroxy-3-methylbut-2-enyl diphosphate reductase [Prochlorococcus sp. AH-736-L15]
HKPLGSELELKNNFLPNGKINVGITSGASTPDKVVADVIEKLIDIAS